MCGVQTYKRRSSHSTRDQSIKFRLFLITLGSGGSVTAFRLLCCVVMSSGWHCLGVRLEYKATIELNKVVGQCEREIQNDGAAIQQ